MWTCLARMNEHVKKWQCHLTFVLFDPEKFCHAREEKMSILAHHLKIWQRNVCVLHSPLISLSTHSHLYLSGHNRHDLADVTALRFGASGHWWSIVYRNVCASMWERIARLFDLCQMHCQLVRVVRERGTDPREHFCARAKPVACGVPDSPALYGPVLTVFSQHQAGMIKSNHWEWLFQSCIKEWRCVSEICGASEGGLPP